MHKFFPVKTEKMKSGEKGEQVAVEYLIQKGYQILLRNYKVSYHEIDLIGRKHDLLVFFEVKSRNSIEYGNPEDFVSAKQKKSVRKGAEMYMEKYNWEGRIRFDIIALIPGEITHFQDAF